MADGPVVDQAVSASGPLRATQPIISQEITASQAMPLRRKTATTRGVGSIVNDTTGKVSRAGPARCRRHQRPVPGCPAGCWCPRLAVAVLRGWVSWSTVASARLAIAWCGENAGPRAMRSTYDCQAPGGPCRRARGRSRRRPSSAARPAPSPRQRPAGSVRRAVPAIHSCRGPAGPGVSDCSWAPTRWRARVHRRSSTPGPPCSQNSGRRHGWVGLPTSWQRSR